MEGPGERLPRVEGFDAFYAAEYSRAVALAYALIGRGAPAEDLAQEVFLTTYQNWQRISGYDDPHAWVRRVLINRATSVLRRRTVEWRALSRIAGRAPLWADGIEPEDGAVWEAVRRLPKRQAQAVVLRYVDELSLEEIGAVLGCSPGTVKAHLARARERLGRKLHDYSEVTE